MQMQNSYTYLHLHLKMQVQIHLLCPMQRICKLYAKSLYIVVILLINPIIIICALENHLTGFHERKHASCCPLLAGSFNHNCFYCLFAAV